MKVDTNLPHVVVGSCPVGDGKFETHNYVVERMLGSGGMGSVYQAVLIDEGSDKGRLVALKFLHLDGADEATWEVVVSRFAREADLAARISHPHVVGAIDKGVDEEGDPFIVFPYVDGTQALLQVMQGKPDLARSPAFFFQVMKQLVRAVMALHSQRIIHRDLKPENILVLFNDDGTVTIKIIDFGIAKMLDDAIDSGGNAKITKPNQIVGTVAYMSPEGCLGCMIHPTTRDPWNVGEHSDIWAMGVIAYELLTGQLPFNGPNDAVILGSISGIEPTPPEELVPDLCPSLAQFVKMCLRKNPWDRPTLSEVVRMLDLIETQLTREGVPLSSVAQTPALSTGGPRMPWRTARLEKKSDSASDSPRPSDLPKSGFNPRLALLALGALLMVSILVVSLFRAPKIDMAPPAPSASGSSPSSSAQNRPASASASALEAKPAPVILGRQPEPLSAKAQAEFDHGRDFFKGERYADAERAMNRVLGMAPATPAAMRIIIECEAHAPRPDTKEMRKQLSRYLTFAGTSESDLSEKASTLLSKKNP